MNKTQAAATRIEITVEPARCRRFNASGRQCGNYTRRVVVLERPGQDDFRRVDCGRHS